MILTATPNAALDRIFFIEEWTPGLPMRIERMVTAVGGKGLDASVSLACQGIPSTALTILAGDTGQEVAALLENYGITAVPIWVEGQTRVAHVIAEKKHKRHTHLIAGGPHISSTQAQDFLNKLADRLPQSSWMICGGSLPQGLDSTFFARLISTANQAGVPNLVDTSALPIEPILKARPTIVKMNEAEFAAAFALDQPDFDALLSEGRKILEAYDLPNLVITLGKAGILALTIEGNFHAQPPPQVVINAAGAGDAISGQLAYWLSKGEGWKEALRWAAAVSAATVLSEATAESRPEDIQRIHPLVSIKENL